MQHRPKCLLVTLGLLAAFAAWPALAKSPAPVQASSGMVVTAQHLASQVGLDVLQQGGNAVDAAVAVGYALAVTLPSSGNIGGGGFMLVHLADGQDIFINFREKASLNATVDMYLDADGEVIPGASTNSWLGIGVPGTVMGLEYAREKYGTMSREALMAPAIALARDGFELVPGDDILTVPLSTFRAEENVAAIFLKDGEHYEVGDTVVQTQLANTLQLISDEGPDAFYKGSIADAVVAASEANGGILSKEDFESYKVAEYEPVTCNYRGYQVISSPPPSSGGTIICEILNILEGYPIGYLGFNSAQTVHLMTEAMRHAYVDRNTYLGDPEFVDNPLERLLSKDYAAQIRAQIVGNRATPSSEVMPGTPPHEGTNTNHYSIVDAQGNAVAVTYTLNLSFGVKKIAGDTGFLLNNELDDFTVKPGVPNAYGLVQGEANAVAPGKTPLSSMSPTVITKDGDIFMVTGSPGGSRIITITLESIMNVIDHGMDVQEAIDAPRIHHQWLPDVLYVERFALSADTRALLEAMGHVIQEGGNWGSAEAILRNLTTGVLYGANDSRRPQGAAMGY
ncbi:MAG: gamma-glutamyltransferase [Trueperaceae bacterium]|nr:gamma-glutamyltransferase [Trueperaceae bacterium]MCC6311644.1 gamma-glutamyltransferase [Trueperaceae bacterium]MCW5818286.1 gamma-glutamyltransferase [Trueperaceae bacterium]